MKIKAIELAQIGILARNCINQKIYRDFDFLLPKIEELIQTACKATWKTDTEDDENISIDELPF